MRIAICVKDIREQEALAKWINQYCSVYGRSCVLFALTQPEQLFEENRSFQVAFLGMGGQDGFLLARRLRDADKNCSIVIIDDTAEYAVKGVRLHASDFIVRPVDFKKVARAMKLATDGGFLS